MIDLAMVAAGAVGGFVGGVSSSIALALATRRMKTLLPASQACVCGHPYTARDTATGRCAADTRREHYLPSGERYGWEWVPCPCTDHASPEQRISTWVPPRLPGGDG